MSLSSHTFIYIYIYIYLYTIVKTPTRLFTLCLREGYILYLISLHIYIYIDELIDVTHLAHEETLQKFQKYLRQVSLAWADQYEVKADLLQYTVTVLGN